MNALNYISLGEKIINVINNGQKPSLEAIASGKINKTNITLSKDYLVKLTETENPEFFGDGLQDWTLDIVHKAKSKYEIVSLILKQNGREIIKGAFSKAKNSIGEVKKYHFAIDELLLQTGHTNNMGVLKKAKRRGIIPEKYKDYMWSLPDKSLQIISDFYGLFDKPKSVEQICGKWNIKPYRVKLLRLQALSELRKRIQDGIPSMRETTNGKYTLEDFVEALNYIKESPEYNFMTGNCDKNTHPIIDEKFLEEIKTVREKLEIIKEWRENVKILQEK